MDTGFKKGLAMELKRVLHRGGLFTLLREPAKAIKACRDSSTKPCW